MGIPWRLSLDCFLVFYREFFCWAFQMTHIPGRSTNNSVAAMLDSDQPSSSAPSSGTNSLTQAVSQALGDSLPRILAALQSHSTSYGSTTHFLAGNLVLRTTSSPSITSSPPLSFPSGSSTGNGFVPFFVSNYCTLGNSALSTPAIGRAQSLLDACGAASGSLSTSTQRLTSSFSLGSSFPSTGHVIAS